MALTCQLDGCNKEIADTNMTLIAVEELVNSCSGVYCSRSHAVVDTLITLYKDNMNTLNTALDQYSQFKIIKKDDQITIASPLVPQTTITDTASQVQTTQIATDDFEDVPNEQEEASPEPEEAEQSAPISDFTLNLINTIEEQINNGDIGDSPVTVEVPVSKEVKYSKHLMNLANSIESLVNTLKSIEGFDYEVQVVPMSFVYDGYEFNSRLYSFYRTNPHFTFNLGSGFDFIKLSFANSNKDAIFKNLDLLFGKEKESAELIFNHIKSIDAQTQHANSNNQII